METLIFLLFALLAVGSSLVVILHRNPVYSTMSLVVTLFSVAVLFVLLGAPFIGALQNGGINWMNDSAACAANQVGDCWLNADQS